MRQRRIDNFLVLFSCNDNFLVLSSSSQAAEDATADRGQQRGHRHATFENRHTLFDKWPNAEIAQVMNVVRITMEIRGGCELYPTFAAWFMDDIGIDYFEELGAVYREGDHPDYGGGRNVQDIEGYQIECGPLFGVEFAKLIGQDNHDALVDHLMNS